MVRGKHVRKPEVTVRGTIVGILVMIVAVVALSWVLRNYVFSAFEIPSGSMEPTIQVNDRVIAEKVSYLFGDPEQGDVITFRDPADPTRVLIKRCIAVAGQTVSIANGKLYVDGVPQKETYVHGLSTEKLNSEVVTYPYLVPEGSIWVMGDNRANSQDSRYFGAIPVSAVNGHAILVYWPFSNLSIL